MKALALLTALAICGSSAASAEALRKNAMTAEAAGRLFASICYGPYQTSVEAAQIKAQRKGFDYDAASGLFVNARKDRQMRINSQRCALRFLTRTPVTELLVRFSDASMQAAKGNIPMGTRVGIGTENAGNGLTRVAARLDK
ncbi:hypothetical protein [Pseudaestuariivita sp.]|uniref:hypothetical protein n=1 Tax=Pseudaestuariivita sp. TaxID=2211669 RepID=UPI004058AD85